MKTKLVDSNQYTRQVDLQFAKKTMLENESFKLVVFEDYYQSNWCSGCGPVDAPVRKIYFGRISGCEICDKCYQREVDWVEELLSVDLDIQYITKEDEDVESPIKTNYPSKRFVKKKKKRQTKDEAYRELLENEANQLRLF